MIRSIKFLFIVVLFASISTVAYALVDDEGLILYFNFDSQKDGVVTDETGGGNDGVLAHASISTETAVYGDGSLLCDTLNSSMMVYAFDALSEYQDNSYLFWVQFTQENNGAWNQLLAKYAPDSDRSPGIWTCDSISLQVLCQFHPGFHGTDCMGAQGYGTEFQVGEWYHLASVKKENTLTFYINGGEVAEETVPYTHFQGEGELYIGRELHESALFYMDDLYVYNRSLSAEKIVNIMDGLLVSVEPQGKLPVVWGEIKGGK